MYLLCLMCVCVCCMCAYTCVYVCVSQEDEIGLVPLTGGVSHYITWLFPRQHKQLKPYLTFGPEAGPKDVRAWQQGLMWLYKKARAQIPTHMHVCP